jgi:rhodanese-related sulfurtransferase
MDGKIFAHAVVIPLPELDERVAEIPTDKPLVVHCAAGYRSAAAVSILENRLNGKVKIFDLGTAVTTF